MRYSWLIIFVFVISTSLAQTPTIKAGDNALPFVLNLPNNGMQGFSMPYMNKVVLLHFYSTNLSKSTFYNKPFNRLAKRYKNAIYRTGDGFEVVSIAVQSDKSAWMEGIKYDTLNDVINGIAVRGYNDDVCKKYGITSLPTDILIDEKGVVAAVNPKITLIEDILDSKKNFQPVKKDVVGTLAYSSNSSDFYKYAKLYLFNAYGDSIARTITDDKGKFTFSEIKLNQDFILKVDNGADIMVSDPIAIYNYKGEKVMESKTAENGFVFYIPSNFSHKITDGYDDGTMEGRIDQIDINKHLTFKPGGMELSPKDEIELKSILESLNKNKSLMVDVTGHASTKLNSAAALTLSAKHANAVKNYLVKKGVTSNRIKVYSRGNEEPLNDCRPPQTCPDAEHAKNQRIEFRIYKD